MRRSKSKATSVSPRSPAQRAWAYQQALARGTPRHLCGPVKVYSPEERAEMERRLREKQSTTGEARLGKAGRP